MMEISGVLIDKIAFEILLIGLIIAYLTIKKYGLEKELTLATMRAFVQLFSIALVLGVLISIDNPIYTVGMLSFMMAFASYIAKSRVPATTGFYRSSIIGISISSTIVIAYTVIMNIFPLQARYILPFGSMVIANCMNATALGLNRLVGEIKDNLNLIETKLSLGLSSDEAAKIHVKNSIRASLIPVINTLEALGLVWIPGTMSGMLLGGADALWAAQYQLFVSFSIFAANAFSTIISTKLALKRIFTKNQQLNEEFLATLIHG